MIQRHHIDRFKELIDSDLYATKGAAASVVISEFPELDALVGTYYKDLRSIRIIFNRKLQEFYPGHAIEYRGQYLKDNIPFDATGAEGVEQMEWDALTEQLDATNRKSKPLDGWTVEEKLDAADLEIQAEGIKVADQLQRVRDFNRIANKSWRQQTREFNAATALNEAIESSISKLPECIVDYPTRSGQYNPDAPVMVVQWSDHHANEVINMGEVNKFDFMIYSRRLQKYVEFLKLQAEAFGAERVVIAFGGDLINSDRLVDEKLTEAANRADALVITAEILFEAIMDIRADYFVDIVGVVGNEGRVGEKQSFAKKAAKYNYDRAVLKVVEGMVNKVTPGDRGMRFFMGDQGINERTFTIHNRTFLLIHGNQGGVAGGAQKTVQAAIGKYAMAKDLHIDHVLAGHFHTSSAGDFFSRNSSMAGTNDYSDSLQFASRAAQNLHVVTRTDMFSMVVDCQDYRAHDGYPIEDLLVNFGVETADGKRLQSRVDDSHVDIC